MSVVIPSAVATTVAANSEPLIQACLDEAGIRCDARRFVSLVSNGYHEAESADYDRIHLELVDAEAAWQRCLSVLAPLLPKRIRVLDVGAGTGFASLQVLGSVANRIDRLVCLDMSPSMVARARERVGARTPAARFVAGDISCLAAAEQFDLIVTNSVLHHIADIPGFCASLSRLLSPGGIYVAGHEPSREFYEHPTLLGWTQAYRRWRSLRRFVSPRAYLHRFSNGPTPPSVEDATNRLLIGRGVIARPLPPHMIRQLVDIHVPSALAGSAAWGLPGFSRGQLEQALPALAVRYITSYSHVKDARARMGPIWRTVDRILARRHPTAGSNLLVAFQRTAAPAN